jgi:membrane peptidoglycan carboxypeptidase
MLLNPKQNQDLGGYGGRLAAPIWRDAMEPILSAQPAVPFPPAGLRLNAPAPPPPPPAPRRPPPEAPPSPEAPPAPEAPPPPEAQPEAPTTDEASPPPEEPESDAD